VAKETSGGRIGRTVYLPQEVWDQLESLAQGQKQHPAFNPYEIRSGSVSAVIEKIVLWDGPAQINSLLKRLAESNRKIDSAQAVKTTAGHVAVQLKAQVAGLVAELTKLNEADL